MKKILIATDFSPESKQAIKCIVDFFQNIQVSCRILLLNAYLIPKNVESKNIIQVNDLAKINSQKGLKKECHQTLKLITDANMQVETISHMGSLTNVISNITKKEKIDLIVMGKDGGKHVNKVTDLLKDSLSACPLLIVFRQSP